MAVKHGILGILERRPRHGYELKAEFDLLTGGVWDLNVGQIYSTLERMRKDGLVALEEGDGAGEDRKVYRLTHAGALELQAWLEHPPLKPRPIRDELYVRLGLLLQREAGGADALLASQERLCQLQLADLTRQKLLLARSGGPDRTWRELLLDSAILHTEADLKWLELTGEKLRLDKGGDRHA